MYKLFSKDIFFYFAPLLPLTFIVGIFVTEIFMFLITLIFLLWNKDFSCFKDSKFFFLFLISIYIAINAFVQIGDDLKISSIFYFRYIFFSLAIVFFLKNF